MELLPGDHHCLDPGLAAVDEEVWLGGDVLHQDGVSQLLLLLAVLKTPEPPELHLHEVSLTHFPPGHVDQLSLPHQPLPIHGPLPELVLQHQLLHTGDDKLRADQAHFAQSYQQNLQRICCFHVTFTCDSPTQRTQRL